MGNQIQVRRDSSTNWTTTNPVLAQGEIGYEIDTDKIKFGDGITSWNTLTYFSGEPLSDAEIKIAYENNTDTNAFTDAEKTKLDFITATGSVNLDTIASYVNQGVKTTDSPTFDNLTVSNNLTVAGTYFTVTPTEVKTQDNIIVLNDGEVGSGVTAGTAGVEIDRGLLTNYRFEFDETSDSFVIGEVGSLQKVATREDTPTDTGVAVWDTATTKFNTTIDLTGLNSISATNITGTIQTPTQLNITRVGNLTQLTVENDTISTLASFIGTEDGTDRMVSVRNSSDLSTGAGIAFNTGSNPVKSFSTGVLANGNFAIVNSNSISDNANKFEVTPTGNLRHFDQNGANATTSKVITTVGVTTTPTQVYNTGNCGLVSVFGESGGDQFCDLIYFTTLGTTPTVIASHTLIGIPSARTYSAAGSGLDMQMDSGTYNITVRGTFSF